MPACRVLRFVETEHRILPWVVTLLLLGGIGCEAGPPAFGDGTAAAADLPDSASVAGLQEPPRAPEVEGEDGEPLNPEADRVPGRMEGAERGVDSAAGPPAGSSREASGEAMAESAPLRFERPEHVRGLYLNAWAAGSTRRVDALLELAAETEINSFVIDIKDATGFVSHHTKIPLAREIGATEEVRIVDLQGLLEKLHAADIYPIARIVIVKDPLLSAARPELAVQDTAGGPWVDGKGTVWLNPYDTAVWRYHVDIAREVTEMGFPEVQWDYVRFPDAPRSELARAVFPGAEDRPKSQAIRDLLNYTREELGEDVQVTADVFGVTTSAARDVGIGQLWEDFIDVVDVAQPMVYPSHYWTGSFGIESPNAFPYEIVRRALEDAVRRSEVVEGAGLTRPWLQDFTLGKPVYEAPEVRAQIQATYDAGLHEWILWNPGSSYTPGALEPAEGWVEEPLIRVADQLVPVSRRGELLEPDETEPPPEETGDVESGATAADSVAPAASDTTGAGGLR